MKRSSVPDWGGGGLQEDGPQRDHPVQVLTGEPPRLNEGAWPLSEDESLVSERPCALQCLCCV